MVLLLSALLNWLPRRLNSVMTSEQECNQDDRDNARQDVVRRPIVRAGLTAG
jgi:hypothetical protein